MDIYRADAFAGKELPVILNIHGGGLILGCKEYNRYFCAQLSKLGYLVFSIESVSYTHLGMVVRSTTGYHGQAA